MSADCETCPTCGDKFSGEMGVLVHHSKVHGAKVVWTGEMWRDDEPGEPCPTCDEKFHTQKGVKIHHKNKHSESIAGERTECEHCNKQFRRRPAKIERADKPFCSVDCHQNWRKENSKTGEESPGWEGATLNIECDACGKEFERYRSKVSLTETNYCSRECYGINRDYQQPEGWDGGKKEYECASCGEILLRWPSQAQCDNIFCDPDCYADWQEGQYDDNHTSPTKRGGLWLKQRKRALRRDGHECQECGLSDEEHRGRYAAGLHVHHKRPARFFETRYEAHALDNLTCLCSVCHKETEAKSFVCQNEGGRQMTFSGVLQ